MKKVRTTEQNDSKFGERHNPKMVNEYKDQCQTTVELQEVMIRST
jgi:hypothetical protein